VAQENIAHGLAKRIRSKMQFNATVFRNVSVSVLSTAAGIFSQIVYQIQFRAVSFDRFAFERDARNANDNLTMHCSAT